MRKSLIDWCIENDAEYLLQEWEDSSNGNLDKKLSYGSEKKVNWKCEKGHVWVASINQRTSTKSKCPYCSGRYAIPYENDLATLFPQLIEEWSYEKNEENPLYLKPASHKKVWWKCKKCGYEWKSVISSRTQGYGCSGCAKKKISVARKKVQKGDSLAERFPELLSEWNIEKNNTLTGYDVAAFSSQKVWWKCNEGHEWNSSVRNYVKGRRCPYCANRKIIAGYNDFASKYPELAKEWDYEKNKSLLPTQLAPSSNKKAWWKCRICGHRWETSINNRVKRGCPQCSKARTVSFPEKAIYYYICKLFDNVIENYRPDFLQGKELDIYIPELNVGIEYDGTLYHQDLQRDLYKQQQCQRNGIKLIRVREPGCPMLEKTKYIIELQNRKTEEYENMIKSIIKILRDIKDFEEDLLDVNLERDFVEINRLVNYKKIDNSIYITNPELIPYWNVEKNQDFTMEKVTYASDKKVWWKCPNCDYEWYGKVCSMTSKKEKNLCPICKQKCRSIKYTHPYLVPYWNVERNENLSIFQVTHGSEKEVWWKCPDCQHEWIERVVILSDKRRKSICQYCKKRI